MSKETTFLSYTQPRKILLGPVGSHAQLSIESTEDNTHKASASQSASLEDVVRAKEIPLAASEYRCYRLPPGLDRVNRQKPSPLHHVYKEDVHSRSSGLTPRPFISAGAVLASHSSDSNSNGNLKQSKAQRPYSIKERCHLEDD